MNESFRRWVLPPDTMDVLRRASATASVPASVRLNAGVAAGVKPYLESLTRVNRALMTQASTLAATLGPMQRSISTYVAQFMPGIVETLRGAIPANLRAAKTSWDIDELNRLMLDEGLPIAWVPRASILNRVFAAPTPAARRAIYGRSWHQIVDDCEELLERADSMEMEQYLFFVKKAINGLREGHHELAQAMIMNTFDTVLQHRFPKPMRLTLTDTRKTLDTDDLSFRLYFAACSIWSLHHRYFPAKGDPIPRTLNRHASVHGVSRRQYTRINAVLALAHLTGLLWFLDSQFSQGHRP